MIRNLFGLFLILVNLIAYIVMLNTGDLVGDVSGFPVKNVMILNVSFFVVIGTYFIFLFPLFNFFTKFKIKVLKIKDTVTVENRLGIFILTFQLLYIFFNIGNGVNIAGSGNIRTESIFSIFWVFFPIDMLFFIYYGRYRNSKYFKVNAVVNLASFLIRGQAGILLLFAFMEISRLYREGKITIKKISLLFLIVIISYPFINIMKFSFRLYFGTDGDDSLNNYIMELFTNNQSEGYFYSLIIGVEHLFYRFQIVSIVAEISRMSEILMNQFDQNLFFPFWSEGLHGLLLDKLSGEPRRYPLGTVFTSIGNFNWKFDIGDWNVNPGIAGWMVLNPLWSGFVFMYCSLLCFISVCLSKLLGWNAALKDLIWFTWAFYLLPGWLGVFVLFIYSLLLFIFLRHLISGSVIRLRQN